VRREGSGVTSRPASGEWGTEKPRLCNKGEGMQLRCPGARKRYEVLIDESRVRRIWLGSLAKRPQGVRSLDSKMEAGKQQGATRQANWSSSKKVNSGGEMAGQLTWRSHH
jgi:hypothetical protein